MKALIDRRGGESGRGAGGREREEEGGGKILLIFKKQNSETPGIYKQRRDGFDKRLETSEEDLGVGLLSQKQTEEEMFQHTENSKRHTCSLIRKTAHPPTHPPTHSPTVQEPRAKILILTTVRH